MRSRIANPQYAGLLGLLNQAGSADELTEILKGAGAADASTLAPALLARRMQSGGVFRSAAELGVASSILDSLEKQLGDNAKKVDFERSHYLALVLSNPNYFGTIKDSPFEVVKPIKYNTTYEELTCVGLKPELDRLEAVIQIKKETGYSGGICTAGSFEHVRFFVDLHDDNVFHDVGVGSVRVYNLPGKKPLHYAVYKDFTPYLKFCTQENLVKVRAILSWSHATPANQPNAIPVWGNVLDAIVQIRAQRFIFFGDILKGIEKVAVPIPDPIGPVIQKIQPEVQLAVAAAPLLSVPERKEAYKRMRVPASRFAYPEVSQALAMMSAKTVAQPAFEQLGLETVEISEILKKLLNPGDGDTSYEELECVGLHPENDMLEAVLTVKKKSGYSGSLCSDGSRELVAFWMDLNDGAGWRYLGTGGVKAYDLQQTPAQGVKYAVRRRAHLDRFKINCAAGARLARIRAILSWSTPPSSVDPNWTPVWGNRIEALVQLDPTGIVGHTPVIDTLCGVPAEDIDSATGLTLSGDRPFGGSIQIVGRILDPPNTSAGATPFKYKLEVAPDGTEDWQALTNNQPVTYSESAFGFPQECAPGEFQCSKSLVASDDGDGLGAGWYTYLEDLTPPFEKEVLGDVLGYWYTNASMEGVWKIRLTAKDPSTSPPTVYPGFEIVKVRIDNTAPTVNLTLDNWKTPGGAWQPAQACDQFQKNVILKGTYSVSDPGTVSALPAFQHFSSLHFAVLPSGNAVNPHTISYDGSNTTGASGTWELDTANMPACGYVIRLEAWDRTIVSCDDDGFWGHMDIGFCIVE